MHVNKTNFHTNLLLTPDSVAVSINAPTNVLKVSHKQVHLVHDYFLKYFQNFTLRQNVQHCTLKTNLVCTNVEDQRVEPQVFAQNVNFAKF